MPGVIRTLADAANPFTVLTKSPLVLRDLDLLREAAKVTQVGALVSVGFVDDRLRRAVEPGAATPQRRLEVCATLNEAGIPCGVLMAPILPLIADSTDHLLATVRRAAEAGAVSVTPVVLRLPAGAREWYMGWLEREHPGLVPRYQALYGRGQVAEDGYRRRIAEQVRALAETYGIGRDARRWRRRRSPPASSLSSDKNADENAPEPSRRKPCHHCAAAPAKRVDSLRRCRASTTTACGAGGPGCPASVHGDGHVGRQLS
ncbi:hypothetical protein GCM10027612_49440 [Microbispora bryophytorum subsp. camponoti]